MPNSNRTYLKLVAMFKCSKGECGREWLSHHAWGRDEPVLCEFCGTNSNISNAVDEKLELDIYNCPTENCGNYWECIHDGAAEGNQPLQECDLCGAQVVADRQSRFGRHYFFNCPADDCQVTWEDFSLVPQKTQRCTRRKSGIMCGSQGFVIAIKEIRVPTGNGENDSARNDRRDVNDGAGKHNAGSCDMCQDLQANGRWKSCIPYRKVKSRVRVAGGEESEEIISAE